MSDLPGRLSAALADRYVLERELGRGGMMLGRVDAAVDQLEVVLSKAGPLSAGWLRADPLWAPLRGNPRFQRLVAVR